MQPWWAFWARRFISRCGPSAILGPYEFALALTGFSSFKRMEIPAWAVVIVLASGGILITI